MDLAFLEKIGRQLEDTHRGRLYQLELEHLKALFELIEVYDREAERREREKFDIMYKLFDMLMKLPRIKDLEEKE